MAWPRARRESHLFLRYFLKRQHLPLSTLHFTVFEVIPQGMGDGYHLAGYLAYIRKGRASEDGGARGTYTILFFDESIELTFIHHWIRCPDTGMSI